MPVSVRLSHAIPVGDHTADMFRPLQRKMTNSAPQKVTNAEKNGAHVPASPDV